MTSKCGGVNFLCNGDCFKQGCNVGVAPHTMKLYILHTYMQECLAEKFLDYSKNNAALVGFGQLKKAVPRTCETCIGHTGITENSRFLLHFFLFVAQFSFYTFAFSLGLVLNWGFRFLAGFTHFRFPYQNPMNKSCHQSQCCLLISWKKKTLVGSFKLLEMQCLRSDLGAIAIRSADHMTPVAL